MIICDAEDMNILVIDNSKHNLSWFQRLLGSVYDVSLAVDGRSGFSLAMKELFHLIIIGSYLPDTTYVRLTDSLRRAGVGSGVLVTPSSGSSNTIVEALEVGADDFILKPINEDILLAKIQAITRRVIFDHGVHTIEVGPLFLDKKAMRVTRDGNDIELKRREYQLLEYMMQRVDEVLSREELLKNIWHGKAMSKSSVDVYVMHLRDKIDKPFGSELLKTVFGYGYKLSPA